MTRLRAPEGRVVASLVEKALTIPQHYPLTLNALAAACNQTSSRDPVTSYDEETVRAALDSLRERRMVRAVLPSHGRSAVRYRHVLDETLGLDASQLAVLAVLELRGPQTVAELRARTERMAEIDSVDHELDLLAGRTPALAGRVGRRPGQKEDRWASLLSEPPEPPEASGPPEAPSAARDGSPEASGLDPLREELALLRAEIEPLRDGLAALRTELAELRDSLGG